MSARPALGKKIKCPACSEVFVPEIDDDETAVQEKPNAKTKSNAPSAAGKKSRATAVDEETEAPKKKAKRFTDEEEAEPKKKAKRVKIEEEDDEEDGDEKPKKKAKKSKKKAGGMMPMVLLILAGGGAVLGLGACAVGAFVWPGFLTSDQKQVAQDAPAKDRDKKSDDKKTPAEFNHNNVIELASPQSAYLFGINTKALRDSNQLDLILGKLDELGAAQTNDKMPPELRELFRNSDMMLVSGMMHEGKNVQIVSVLMSTGEALANFKKSPSLGEEAKLNDKYRIHRPPLGKTEMPKSIVFTGDRTVVLSDLPDEAVTQILDPIFNKQIAPSPAVPFSKAVESSHLWGAWAFDDAARMLFNDPGEAGKQFPQLQQAAQVMQQAKGGNLGINFDKAKWTIRLNVECASDNDAKTLRDAGEEMRTAAAGFLSVFGGAKTPPSITSDFNSIRIQNQASTTTLSGHLSSQTITELTKKQPLDPKKDLASKDARDKSKDFNIDRVNPKTDVAKDLAKDGIMPKKDFAKDGTMPKKDLVKDGIMPKKDFNPKDIGGKDNTKPNGPYQFQTGNLTAGARREFPFQLGQGRTVNIQAQHLPLKQKADIRIELLRGAAGENVISQGKNAGKATVITMPVPATDVYRLRITNLGPGPIVNAQAVIFEK